VAYLIDTDIYIYLTAGNQEIRDRIEAAGEDNIFISAITVAELYFGAFASKQKDKNLKVIWKNLENLQILNFNKHSGKVFGRLKAELKKKGRLIADMDLAIASIAIQNQHVMVTHNLKHFNRIDELLIEDWCE
jgi:tRNA(fMet)-specific endonuclease VapC